MARFHELKVIDIRQETEDAISIAFEVPDNLKEDFEFIHGQYITLKHTVNGEELRRSYSICSSPASDEPLRIAVKKVPQGRVSTFLNEKLKVGDSLEVMTPMGNFYTQLKKEHKKQYVAFAAGSGITPVISIIKTILHKEPDSNVILFYGNRTELSIIFKDELERLMNKYGERLKIYHILSREQLDNTLFSGRITADKVRMLLKEFADESRETEYFICGPEGMMREVTGELEERGVDKKHIHVELFTSPVESEDDVKKKKEKKAPSSGGDSHVTIVLDGEETEIELSPDGDAILDAALEAGLDVPFACKGAVCCTCKAKLMEGEVDMDMNYALSDEEVEEGYILTCQSHPKTDKVVVDYDEGI